MFRISRSSCLGSEHWTPPPPRIFDLRRQGWCLKICFLRWRCHWCCWFGDQLRTTNLLHHQYLFYKTRELLSKFQCPLQIIWVCPSVKTCPRFPSTLDIRIDSQSRNAVGKVIESSHHEANFFKIKYNPCLVLSPGHRPDRREISVLFVPCVPACGSCLFSGGQKPFISNDQHSPSVSNQV